MVVIGGNAERAANAYAKSQLTLNLEARPKPARRELDRVTSAAQRSLRISHLKDAVSGNLLERAQKTLNITMDSLSRADPGKDSILLEEIVRIYNLVGTYGQDGSRSNLHLREMPSREQVEEAGKLLLGFSRAYSRGKNSHEKFRIISKEEREADHAYQSHNNFNLLQSLHTLIQDREYNLFLELLDLVRQKCIEEANAPRKKVNFGAQTHEMQVYQLLSMDGTISRVKELASLEN